MSKEGGSYVQLTAMFAVWYAFNAGYNVFNSYVKPLKYPIIISALQLVVGLAYALPLWVLGIRQAPRLSFNDIMRIMPICLLNAIGHSATVIATFQKGGGSFTHVIKASEPVVSVLLGLIINGKVPPLFTALSLLPITYGVAYASTLGHLDAATMSHELTTVTSIMAMIGNVSFALRSILRKNLPPDFRSRTNLTPANDHAVTTIISALLTLPVAFYYETPAKIMDAYNGIADKNEFLMYLFACGMCFYIYNEVQNKVLGQLGAVPTAVGNTLKRVVIFVALYAFTAGETFPMPKIVGCAIAITGCLAYAVFNSKNM